MEKTSRMSVELRAPKSWCARVGTRFAYKVFGPTTVHLDHEMCLLVTATCLTCASLLSIYKSSFGSMLDIFYLIFSTLWLSRHFFHRLICTSDVGTSLSGWTHHLRWIWIIATCGGQYFDVPTSMFASTSYQLLIDDSYARSKSGDVSRSIPLAISPFAFHRIWIIQETCVSFMAATWAGWIIVKLKLSPRTLTAFDLDDEDWSSSTDNANNKRGKNSSEHSKKSTKNFSSFGQTHRKCRRKLNKKLDRMWQYVPSLQVLVLVISICGFVWFFQKYNEALSSYSLPLRTSRSVFFDKNMANPRMANIDNHSMQQRDLSLPNTEYLARRFDAIHGGQASSALWSRNFVYSPVGIVCMVMSCGIISSILFFCRIMLPLPDLVSGVDGNVGRGNYKSSRSNNSEKAWSEQQKSIVNENRARLHIKVLVLRVFEYIMLCAILPRTEFICKATGHCDIEPMISESGNPTLVGMTGTPMYNQLIRHRWQEALITCTVILTTTLILVVQVIVLDKSYLALKSYSTQEANSIKKSGGARRKSMANSDTTAFDFPGDNGNSHSDGMLSSAFNVFRDIKTSSVELFGNELGALSTSRVLAIGSNVHVIYTLLVVIMWLYYAISGANWYSFFLIYLSLFSSAVEVGYLEPSVLNNIAAELNSKHSVN